MKGISLAGFLVASLLLTALFALIAVPVLAAEGQPDTITISSVHCYRHCLEDDDMLVIVLYDLEYDTNPEDSIEYNFFGRLVDSGTPLASTTPYSYYDQGYNWGIYSFYFNADDAPTWEGSYTVRLEGNPTQEWLSETASTALAGAVADDGGVQTDETTGANNATANDITLLPAIPAVHDAYYFGGEGEFNVVRVNIGTAGAGTWVIIWEYWNGTVWDSLAGISDGTNGFTAPSGSHNVTFTLPDDWEETEVDSISAYWIRARVYDYTDITTQPKGSQAWVNYGADPPATSTTSINWHGTTTPEATEILLESRVLSLANTLGDRWQVELTTETTGGTVLNSSGVQYFSNSIYNLRDMVPDVFPSGVEGVVFEEEDHPQTYQTALMGRIDSDDMLGRPRASLANTLGTSEAVSGAIIFFLGLGAVVWGIVYGTGGQTRPIAFVLIPLVILGNLTGLLNLAFTLVIGLMAIIASGYVIFYSKSAA